METESRRMALIALATWMRRLGGSMSQPPQDRDDEGLNDDVAVPESEHHQDDEGLNEVALPNIELLKEVYDKLKERAHRLRRRERDDFPLQTTEVLHETLIRTLPYLQRGVSRAEYLRIAATAMRNFLTDHARSRGRLRRGWNQLVRVDFDEQLHGRSDAMFRVVRWEVLLEALREFDATTADVAQMKLFASATLSEIQEALGLSAQIVKQEWRLARAWIVSKVLEQEPNGASADAKAQ